MAGGAAIGLFLVFTFLVPKTAALGPWAIALWYASFLVNYPHFMASYQLMYGDARAGFLDFKGNRGFALKLWWAGIIVPALLISYFLFALSRGSLSQMGFLAQAMYFFVGWHYIKQVYGSVIVLSAAKKIFYSQVERYSLLVPLYLLWAVSFINPNLALGSLMYQGVPYALLGLPPRLLEYVWLSCLVASAWMVMVFITKYRFERKLPPWSALAAIASIYLWFSPSLAHPMYFYVIPLLHSLQYLLFVMAYKRNAAAAETASDEDRFQSLQGLNTFGSVWFLVVPVVFIGLALYSSYTRLPEAIVGEWYRLLALGSMEAWMVAFGALSGFSILAVVLKRLPSESPYVSFGRFFLASSLIGAAAFCLVPVFLDVTAQAGKLPGVFSYPALFGGTLYVFFITIFINIHHYFIDNVIWKRDNPYVREHLSPRAVPVSRGSNEPETFHP